MEPVFLRQQCRVTTWRMQGLEAISWSSCWQGGRVLRNSGLAEVQEERWGMGEAVCIDINVLIRMNFFPQLELFIVI